MFKYLAGPVRIAIFGAPIVACAAPLMAVDPVWAKLVVLAFAPLVAATAASFRARCRIACTVLGEDAEVGVGVMVGIKARCGAKCRIGPGAAINHGAKLGDRVEVGAMAYVGVCAKIADGIRIAEGAVIPSRAVIATQEQADAYGSQARPRPRLAVA